MFRLLKSKNWFFVLALLFLVCAILAFQSMSSWFWIFLAAAALCCLCGLGIIWIIKTAIWFGVFWTVKLWCGFSAPIVGSFVAFTAATITTRLFGRIYWTLRRSRWDARRQQAFERSAPPSFHFGRQ